jgi:hypothetical protein
MDRTLFDQNGKPVAYLHTDYHGSIFLWDGNAVAYLDDEHIFGINGKHLGWLISDVLYTNDGARIGFTSVTCPVPTDREPAKAERRPVDQIQPKWHIPPTPKLMFHLAEQDLETFLKGGAIPPFRPESRSETHEETEG